MIASKDQPIEKASDLKIVYHHYLVDAPIMSLMLRCYAELIDQGYHYPNISWSNNDHCFAVYKDGKIVGGMVFRTEQDTLWLIFSFVHPEYRGQGIYQRMFRHIEKFARTTLKSKRITSMVSMENKSQLEASKKVGMLPTWYRMFKKLT